MEATPFGGEGEASEATSHAVTSPSPAVFSFYLSELAQYEVTSESYHPFRARLCHALCEAFHLETESKAEILATRTDLGQFHADNYLGLLQISAELWAFEAQDKSRKKRTKTEDLLVQERLAIFNLDLPLSGKNSVFAGMFAYNRLCVTGSLAAATRLSTGASRIAINWFGGHSRARKARAVAGCFVNDSVLACLSLIRTFQRILHVSMDFAHCDAVEEAFYTSDRVVTLSFHSSSCTTGLEADTGYGIGTGYALNVPIKPSCFTDKVFVPLFSNMVRTTFAAYAPTAVVFIASPSVIAGNRDGDLNLSLGAYLDCVDVVLGLDVPTLILGGAGSSPSVAAMAWCAATARCLGTDVLGKQILETCPMKDHFAVSKGLISVESRPILEPAQDVAAVKALEDRICERLGRSSAPVVKTEPGVTVG